MILTEAREQKFKKVIANRQQDFTIILENVHDPHNIGAVMRSCDAVGVHEIFLVYTEKKLQEKFDIGHKAASGTKKWVVVNYFENLEECMTAVKMKYGRIFATHMAEESVDLHQMDLINSIALLFGNEHDGVSKEALGLCDGNFIIPQFGMVQSLNISVACAVSLYEGLRQRKQANKYKQDYNAEDPFQQDTYNKWYAKQLNR